MFLQFIVRLIEKMKYPYTNKESRNSLRRLGILLLKENLIEFFDLKIKREIGNLVSVINGG